MALSVAFVLTAVLWAGFACGGGSATGATAVAAGGAIQSTNLSTTTVISDGAAFSDTPGAPNPEVQKLLDDLREAARLASFGVYYLGKAYGNATIAGVMSASADSSSAPGRVDILYRSAGSKDQVVVYISEYDAALRPDLKKPLSDWTFIGEVKSNGQAGAIYRATDGGDSLFCVAQRGSTEITLSGYTSGGHIAEERLIEILSLLVPVL
ncbi:MAG: hypothetical protein M1274_06535 [Actinobacteria bacterium]|nr:hypothetical protein [Actinomycetota bacterium]